MKRTIRLTESEMIELIESTAMRFLNEADYGIFKDTEKKRQMDDSWEEMERGSREQHRAASNAARNRNREDAVWNKKGESQRNKWVRGGDPSDDDRKMRYSIKPYQNRKYRAR